MNNISKLKLNAQFQYEKGYRIMNGKLISPKQIEVTGYLGNNGYMMFGNRHAAIHQLAAYQKFGDKWLYDHVQVRHLDGNKLNNDLSNIELGSHRDNYLDILPIIREQRATSLKNLTACPIVREKIGMKLRHLDNEMVRNIRLAHAAGVKYINISKQYNVSKYIITNIINGRSYKTIAC